MTYLLQFACLLALARCCTGSHNDGPWLFLGNCEKNQAPGELCEIDGVYGQCDEHGVQTGSNRLKCMRTGPCGALPWNVTNGVYVLTNITEVRYDATAELRCFVGFTTNGPATISCTIDQTWTEPSVECTPVVCDPLPTIANGSFTLRNNNTFLEAADLQCDPGFKVVGGTCSVICQANGNWSETSAYCGEMDCHAPPCTPFGTFVPTAADSRVAVLECYDGYENVGTPTVQCHGDGSWTSSSATCTPVACAPYPTDSFGTFVPRGNGTFGDVLVLDCGTDSGYTAVGEACDGVCLANGTWSPPSAYCAPVDCGTPPCLQYGQFDLASSPTTFGNTASLTCETGYSPDASATITCQSDGAWSPSSASCVPTACPAPPNVTDGEWVQQANGAYLLECDVGFGVCGEPCILVCMLGGILSNSSATCEPVDCGAVPITPYGLYTRSSGSSLAGSNATVQCLTGYEPSGDGLANCQNDGTWTGVDTCDPVDCGSPGGVNFGSWSTVEGQKYQHHAILDCDTNYGPTTHDDCYRVCLASGSWSANTNGCSKMGCGNPPCIDKGQYGADGNNLIGDTATLTCIYGFETEGDDTQVTCALATGWSAPAATCTEIDCNSPTDPTDGSWDLDLSGSTTLGSFGDINCPSGKHVEQNPCSIVCLPDESWSPTSAECIINDCGNPPCLYYGSWDPDDTTTVVTDTASLDCDYGFQGSGSLTCQAAGTWSPSSETCKPVDCTGCDGVADGSYDPEPGVNMNIADLNCDDGYEVQGTICSRVCQPNAQWTAKRAHCERQDCGSPPCIAGGKFVLTGSLDMNTHENDTAILECDEYFTLSQPSTITCTDGAWSSNIATCDATQCGFTPLTTDGMYFERGNNNAPDIADLVCLPGYEVSGSCVITCDGSGWESATGTCIRIDCGPVPDTGNGSFVSGATKYGDEAMLTCDAGFESVEIRIECGIFGSWTVNANTKCEPTGPTLAMAYDCADIADILGESIEGYYQVLVNGANHEVYCAGSVTVMQVRLVSNGFAQNWTAYKDGFGNVSNSFYWAGLDLVSQITNGPYNYRLKVLLMDPAFNVSNLSYEYFAVGSEATNYVLSVSGYSGPPGLDSFTQHDGYQFSTCDDDNDPLPFLDCALTVGGCGGWWYNAACVDSNLNGGGGLSWINFPYSLTASGMGLERR